MSFWQKLCGITPNRNAKTYAECKDWHIRDNYVSLGETGNGGIVLTAAELGFSGQQFKDIERWLLLATVRDVAHNKGWDVDLSSCNIAFCQGNIVVIETDMPFEINSNHWSIKSGGRSIIHLDSGHWKDV